jgi:hypothetical protein
MDGEIVLRERQDESEQNTRRGRASATSREDGGTPFPRHAGAIYALTAASEKLGITSCANNCSERSACWWGKVPQTNEQIT